MSLMARFPWVPAMRNPTPQDPIAGTHMCASGDCVIDSATLVDGIFSFRRIYLVGS